MGVVCAMETFSDDWLVETIESLAKDGFARGLDETAIQQVIEEAIAASLPDSGKKIAESLVERLHTMISEHNYQRTEFQSRLLMRWFEGIDLLEAVIVALTELGEDLNSVLRAKPNSRSSHLTEVLTRFHARA